MEAFQKSIDEEKEKIKKIKKYIDTEVEKIGAATDEDLGKRQFYKDMSLLQDAYTKILDEFVVLKGVLENANENKVSGRLDLTKMNLANANWLGSSGIYQMQLL